MGFLLRGKSAPRFPGSSAARHGQGLRSIYRTLVKKSPNYKSSVDVHLIYLEELLHYQGGCATE